MLSLFPSNIKNALMRISTYHLGAQRAVGRWKTAEGICGTALGAAVQNPKRRVGADGVPPL